MFAYVLFWSSHRVEDAVDSDVLKKFFAFQELYREKSTVPSDIKEELALAFKALITICLSLRALLKNLIS